MAGLQSLKRTPCEADLARGGLLIRHEPQALCQIQARRGSAPSPLYFIFYPIRRVNYIRAENCDLAAHLNCRVDVSGTMLRLPGVTSSAARRAYVQIRTRCGGRRAGGGVGG